MTRCLEQAYNALEPAGVDVDKFKSNWAAAMDAVVERDDENTKENANEAYEEAKQKANESRDAALSKSNEVSQQTTAPSVSETKLPIREVCRPLPPWLFGGEQTDAHAHTCSRLTQVGSLSPAWARRSN